MKQGPNWIVDASSGSHVYHQADMVVRKSGNGGESRDVVKGTLITGEAVSIHESEQPQGLAPNPAHVIQHTEIVCVSEGVLEFQHDGKTERAKAGDILLVAKGTLHQFKNVGDGPLKYTVVAVGGDAYKPTSGGQE